MKKLILFSLFIGPLIFFVLLDTGDYTHKTNPEFTNPITDIPVDDVSFTNKINIINFLGSTPFDSETEIFNFHEAVFKKIAKYETFQAISFYTEKGTDQIQVIQKRIALKQSIQAYSLYIRAVKKKRDTKSTDSGIDQTTKPSDS